MLRMLASWEPVGISPHRQSGEVQHRGESLRLRSAPKWYLFFTTFLLNPSILIHPYLRYRRHFPTVAATIPGSWQYPVRTPAGVAYEKKTLLVTRMNALQRPPATQFGLGFPIRLLETR